MELNSGQRFFVARGLLDSLSPFGGGDFATRKVLRLYGSMDIFRLTVI